jgi:hypothetical protein
MAKKTEKQMTITLPHGVEPKWQGKNYRGTCPHAKPIEICAKFAGIEFDKVVKFCGRSSLFLIDDEHTVIIESPQMICAKVLARFEEMLCLAKQKIIFSPPPKLLYVQSTREDVVQYADAVLQRTSQLDQSELIQRWGKTLVELGILAGIYRSTTKEEIIQEAEKCFLELKNAVAIPGENIDPENIICKQKPV